MIPDWLIHTLDVSELRRLADTYGALSRLFQSRANDLEDAARETRRRQAAAATKRSATWERDRAIILAYQSGAAESAIAQKAGLSERQVRRIARKALAGLPGRLAALPTPCRHHRRQQQPASDPGQPAGQRADIDQAKTGQAD